MKQNVFGVFLIMVFVFVALLGYTRQQTLSTHTASAGNLLEAQCFVMPLNRRYIIKCHIDCVSHQSVFKEACMKQIIVSHAVGKQIEQALKTRADIRVRLSADDIQQAHITQIFINGRAYLKPKVVRE